jgi:threonine aldolase
MVFFDVVDPTFDFCAFEAYLAQHHVKINPNYNGYRFVTHYWITREDIDTLITLIKNYAKN